MDFLKDINRTTIATTPNKQTNNITYILSIMVVDDLLVVVGVVEMGRQHVAGGGLRG